MQIFAAIDLVIALFDKMGELVKRKQEADDERVRETKRSFLARITGRKVG